MYLHRRIARPVAVAATLTIVISTLAACSSGDEPRPDEPEDEFIGAPPEDDDDPLFEHALPAEAVPADPTGRVGQPDDPPEEPDPDEISPEARQQISALETEVERLENQLARLEDQLDQPDEQLQQLRDQVDELEDELEDREDQLAHKEQQLEQKEQQLQQRPEPEAQPPGDIPADREACFSCVQICPIDETGQSQCPPGADDLICGWGSHEDDPEQARQAAHAECESSLDMARDMPNYASIEGECPPATCR